MRPLDNESLKIEQDKLELDAKRLLHDQRFDELRYELDRMKVQADGRFANKHFATIITSLVSLVAVIVSLSQIFVAYTSKQKEIEMAQIAATREREMTAAQQNRDWNLKAAEFVATHQDLIFGRDAEKRARIAEVMLVTFPPEITSVLFQKLAVTAAEASIKEIWFMAQTGATKLLLIRVDGLYQAKEGDYTSYIRFFPDGTVLEVSSTGTAAEVARWLVRNSNYSQGKVEVKRTTEEGALEVHGAALKFSTTSSAGVIDYEGTVRNDKMTLSSYSHINGNRSTRTYEFVQLSQTGE